MNNARLTLIRLDADDVIATSGGRFRITNAFDQTSKEDFRSYNIKEGGILNSSVIPTDIKNDSYLGIDPAYGQRSGILSQIVDSMYGEDCEKLDEATVEKVYAQIKDAKFMYETEYLWYDRDGDNVHDEGEEITFSDVIRSTSGSSDMIAVTEAMEKQLKAFDAGDTDKNYIDVTSENRGQFGDLGFANNQNGIIIACDYTVPVYSSVTAPYFLTKIEQLNDGKYLLTYTPDEDALSEHAGKYRDKLFSGSPEVFRRLDMTYAYGVKGKSNYLIKGDALSKPYYIVTDNNNYPTFFVSDYTEGSQLKKLRDIFDNTVWRLQTKGDEVYFVNDTKYHVVGDSIGE